MNASMKPVPKVTAAAAAGAATVVLVYLLDLIGVQVPAEVAQALTVLVGFVAGYLAPRA